MIRRIVLEELSGLRRIGGIFDTTDVPEFIYPKHIGFRDLTCYWVNTRPRYVLYREYDPEAVSAEGLIPPTPTPTPESI